MKQIIVLVLALLLTTTTAMAYWEDNQQDFNEYPEYATTLLKQGEAMADEHNQIEIRVEGIGTDYAELEINYLGRDVYNEKADIHGGDSGFVPGGHYPEYTKNSNLLQHAKTLYRGHKDCRTEDFNNEWYEGYEVISLADGYGNYVCRNRYQAQCIQDGSFDTYYDEACDFGVVKFDVGETKWTNNYGIQLTNVTDEGAIVKIVAEKTESIPVTITPTTPAPEQQGPVYLGRKAIIEAIIKLLRMLE